MRFWPKKVCAYPFPPLIRTQKGGSKGRVKADVRENPHANHI